MKKTLYIVFLSGALLTAGCTKNKVAGNYTNKTECLGVELDGSQTLKVWGNGRERLDAVEQAKKNGVRDVLFKGILEGKQECNVKPVLAEVNVQEKNEDYFNKFFADGGEYKNYVSLKDEKVANKISRNRKAARESVTHGVVVRILRVELKQKMVADGILKL